MRELTDNEERRIREYVISQSPANTQVTLIQKIGTRKIIGRFHHIYDVHTNDGRWWVISDPMMNLYSQDDLPKLEMVLTFHIGLCTMLAERSRKQVGKPDDALLAGAWRRFERAVDAYNDADEAEAYQGVGVLCREALLALVRDESEVVAVEEPPALADFKNWSTVLISQYCHGRMRAYAVTLARHTWDIAVWLQHFNGAGAADAEIVLDATGHFLATYSRIKLRHTDEPEGRCPLCDSYRLEDGSHLEGNQWLTVTVCAACGWRDEQTH